MYYSAICIVVGVLLIAATAYDMKLSREVRRRRQRADNMAARPQDLKLQINSLDDITANNGKKLC